MERKRISTSVVYFSEIKKIVFISMILLTSCAPPDIQHYFKIINNSNYSISYYVGNSYPDTVIVQSKPDLKIIQANSSIKESHWGTWEERYNETKEGKISVFIFNTDTLSKYCWEEIRDKYMILHRFDLGLKDMERCEFTITYP